METSDDLQELKGSIRARLERYMLRSGLRFNPDSELVDQILSGLAHRQSKFGKAYCPCRALEGDSKIDAKKVCPCAWHRDEIAQDGMCHCRLFAGPADITK